jgi:hypothetical protein
MDSSEKCNATSTKPMSKLRHFSVKFRPLEIKLGKTANIFCYIFKNFIYNFSGSGQYWFHWKQKFRLPFLKIKYYLKLMGNYFIPHQHHCFETQLPRKGQKIDFLISYMGFKQWWWQAWGRLKIFLPRFVF